MVFKAPHEILDRVRRLLARAAHIATPEEEARTSGVIAARLIEEHKLILIGPTTSQPPPRETQRGPQEAWRNDGRARYEPRTPNREDDLPSPAHARQFNYRIVYSSKFSGNCRACGQGYLEGDAVAWVKGGGATHARRKCVAYWEKRGACQCGELFSAIGAHRPQCIFYRVGT